MGILIRERDTSQRYDRAVCKVSGQGRMKGQGRVTVEIDFT